MPEQRTHREQKVASRTADEFLTSVWTFVDPIWNVPRTGVDGEGQRLHAGIVDGAETTRRGGLVRHVLTTVGIGLRRWLSALRAMALRPVLQDIRTLQDQQAANARRLEALISLLAVIRPRAPLPSFRGWRARPDFATILVSEVLRVRPKCVVELGSGLSTLVLGYALEPLAGNLVSIEHDEEYARQTQAAVSQHGLEECVTVEHAPLEEWVNGQRWYGLQWLRELPPIDLLVVDGPPGCLEPFARYPAIPALAKHLAPGAVILVDDGYRAHERAMVAQWLQEHPGMTATEIETEQGAVVLRFEQ